MPWASHVRSNGWRRRQAVNPALGQGGEQDRALRQEGVGLCDRQGFEKRGGGSAVGAFDQPREGGVQGAVDRDAEMELGIRGAQIDQVDM